MTFCCFKPLPRVSFCEIPIQIGHISFGILESLIDSYCPIGAKTDQDWVLLSWENLLWHQISSFSVQDNHLEILSVTKRSVNQKYFVVPTIIHWNQYCHNFCGHYIHIGVWCFNLLDKVRIFLNPYLLLLFIYGYIKCFLYSFKISISTILNNENGLLIFLVFLHRSHSKETKNYRIKIYIWITVCVLSSGYHWGCWIILILSISESGKNPNTWTNSFFSFPNAML